jgi:hypothetical protein
MSSGVGKKTRMGWAHRRGTFMNLMNTFLRTLLFLRVSGQNVFPTCNDGA